MLSSFLECLYVGVGIAFMVIIGYCVDKKNEERRSHDR
jgi:hypothetical protein